MKSKYLETPEEKETFTTKAPDLLECANLRADHLQNELNIANAYIESLETEFLVYKRAIHSLHQDIKSLHEKLDREKASNSKLRKKVFIDALEDK